MSRVHVVVTAACIAFITSSAQAQIAIGRGARAPAGEGTAVGFFARAGGTGSTAIGFDATATGDHATAMGSHTRVGGDGAAALGVGARAGGDNSVALGANSVAMASDVVSVGNRTTQRRIIRVASGINPTDAVNVSQLDAATSANATAIAVNSAGIAVNSARLNAHSSALGAHAAALTSHERSLLENRASIDFNSGSISTNASDIGRLFTGLDSLSGEVQELRRVAFRGIAAASALGVNVNPSAPGKTGVAVGAARFGGENALGVSVTHRFAAKALARRGLIVNFGYASAAGGASAGRIGGGFQF